MEIIQRKILALCTVNLEIIQRIKERAYNEESIIASIKSFVVFSDPPKIIKRVKGFTYNLQRDPRTLTYTVVLTEQYELYNLSTWNPELSFVPLRDTFNDNINYKCTRITDIERLCNIFRHVVPKYVLFGNNEKVMLEMERFKEMSEQIQYALGLLEARIADEVPKSFDDELQVLNGNIREVNSCLDSLDAKLGQSSLGNHKRMYMYNEHKLQEKLRRQKEVNHRLRAHLQQVRQVRESGKLDNFNPTCRSPVGEKQW